MTINHCPDCGAEIAPRARRCRRCYEIHRFHRPAPPPPLPPCVEDWDDCPELFAAFVPHPPAGGLR